MTALLLLPLLAGGLAAWTWWVYRRLELPVRRRGLLAGLRSVALFLLVLLLLDVRLPWAEAAGGGGRWVLLDASLSMGAVDATGRSAWAAARARADELESGGWRVVAFGAGALDSVPDDAVTAGTELARALEGAVEAGASEIRVLSDLRFQDPVEVEAVLAGGAAPVSFESFGGVAVAAGVTALQVDDAVRADEPVQAEVEVFADGAGDSLTVEFFEEDRLVASRTLAAPAPGLTRRYPVELPAPAGEGRVRYAARLRVDGDPWPEDDEAVDYATTGYREGALVFVSLSPDWEPRWLLPVLEDVTGLPTTGYLRAAPDRFLPMGRALDRGPTVDSATVRRAADEAALLVVHGVRGGADPWVASVAGRAPRLLGWPLDAAGASAFGLTVSSPRGGEWYAAQDVPPSPVAPELAGMATQGLPPLSDLMVRAGGAAGDGALLVQLGGTGPGEPALLLTRPGGRRVAVPLAVGFRRWAVRDGAARDAYRRVWSGVAGWLLAADATASAPEVRPERRVVPRDADVRWLLADTTAVRVEIVGPDGAARDTSVAPGRTGTGPLAPGTYTYRAVAHEGAVVGEGRFDVARTTRELATPARMPETPEAVARRGADGIGGAGRPLRTSPWPYLLVLVLLCAEWIGRRRVGLR